MRYFEDIEVGEVWDLGQREVDEAEIVEFATKYDPQPFHIDAVAAVKQAPPTVQCRITLQTKANRKTGHSEIEQAGSQVDKSSANRHQSAAFWPFKKQEQTMMIEFKQYPTGYRFSAFDINSPFGIIKGRPVL